MKIKRFFAKDMRTALAEVKEALGSDAVIMSNKKVSGGIEIVAAIDYDEPKPNFKAAKDKVKPTFMDMADDQVSLGAKTVKTSRQPFTKDRQASPAPAADSLKALLERQQSKVQSQQIQKQTHQKDIEMPAWARGLEARAESKSQTSQQNFARKDYAQPKLNANASKVAATDEMQAMKEELASLRSLLTHQVSSLMSDKKQQTDPVGAMLESKLLEAEFSPEVAKQLADLAQHYKPAELVQVLPQSLSNMLDNQGDDIVNRGGVVAFVGPTGVGKTTSLAKLAARFAAKHGNDQVALITMDHYRIGAYEQLATYGKIMGCPVKLAHDMSELEQTLYQFRNRKLILIDTAGMGQRDQRLYQQLDNLAANKRIPIRNYLVLSATSQRRVLQDAVEYFKRVPLAGAVLTKLDESVSLSSALSVLIANDLPLSYVTDGQRVPEDLHVADTMKLAQQALSVMDEQEPNFLRKTVRATELAHAFE
ncbi:MAG: flagellar biosynthesis protein FlhF [Shewanella sp.]|nr:flagellar biosynthesis protein FlhF [Shewanella sp.]